MRERFPHSLRQSVARLTTALVVMGLAASIQAAEPNAEPNTEPNAASMEFFERKIRPVLVEHCYACHSDDAQKAGKLKGGLALDTRAALHAGGDSGPAVVDGKPDESLLIEALRYESFQMPPAGQLPETVVADFVKWIEMGTPDPRDGATAAVEEPTIDYEAARQEWAFQRPQRHPAPAVQNAGWVRRPTDAFILARLEAAGLSPSEEADRRTLIRRVTFDLIGLPPTPAEVNSFVNDPSPDAYERLVGRLLDSPHYGERWARLWLDVVRYAEDQAHIVGSNDELTYPNAYLYRDWVIDALNRDVPYDRFIKLQLAADLMPDADGQLVALGMMGLGPKYYRRGALEVMADEWEDRVDVLSRGLLGVTVACARCHDHKYDPIAQEDYYAIAGVFASTEMFNKPLDKDRKTKKNGQTEKPQDAMHIVREGKPHDLPLFIRGNVRQKGDIVPRRFLPILCSDEPKPFTEGSGRLELAEAIADRENPLTARVIVNRIWGAHFGQPIVGTPSNFGRLGEEPTHPDLLDDLAVRFMENGWSLKWLHREIVLSAAYRQCSSAECGVRNAELKKKTPALRTPHSALRTKNTPHSDNSLLWRQSRRRLSIEAWRDAVLAVSGRLERSVGGRSIDPQDPDETRRTIYARISRLELNSMLQMFDFPDPNAHSDGRNNTVTPLQKLFVLNHPFMVRQADALVERLEAEAGPDDAARIRYAYELLYGRQPTAEELQLGQAFLSGGKERWPQYAQALLASNEMLFVD